MSGPRGAVIIPAHNEAAVIGRTLASLGPAAVTGAYRLIVVCNGCRDNTAEIVRHVPGAELVELGQSSKTEALNVGDQIADVWPRLYLDADVQITPASVIDVFDRLCKGDVLAARPDCRFDLSGADWMVRSYYRARGRVFQENSALWGAGAYAVTEAGHARFGSFPELKADDLFVDSLFQEHEKAIVMTQPVVVTTPRDARSLLLVLRRWRGGEVELAAATPGTQRLSGTAGWGTAIAVVRSIRGVQSAADALVYVLFALSARVGRLNSREWIRDESSRKPSSAT